MDRPDDPANGPWSAPAPWREAVVSVTVLTLIAAAFWLFVAR